MLRSIIVRNEVAKSSLKKVIRANVVRCLSAEVTRRKQKKLLHSTNKRIFPTSQCIIQYRLYSDYPSHIEVKLPALSPTMDTGTIISWEKKEGDELHEGDLLCEIETDKATMGFETPEEGFLAKILIDAGAKDVPVGRLLCIIVDKKDSVAAFKDYKPESSEAAKPSKSAAAPPAPEEAAPSPASASSAGKGDDSGSRVYASPMAKRLAEIKKLRLEGTGSGLYGSLKAGDLAGMSEQKEEAAAAPEDAVAPAQPAPGQAYVDVPLSNMRSVIAKRLTASKQTVPHYQLSATCNVDKLIALRKSINEQLEKDKVGVKISVNDFIIKAVASACKRVPAVNAHWMETYVRQFTNVDVSVAVATPAGLITPIIKNADSRGIIDISKAMKELAARAKDNKLKPEEFQGGTITVSNLGMFGITMFNAIINPPQSLILACGGPQDQYLPDLSAPEGWRLAKYITVTASADHRVIDGAVGAEWMKILKSNLEDPVHSLL